MAEETSTSKRRPRAVMDAIPRRFSLLLVGAVLLLAAYVSAGRQFMPAISGYSGFIESQIFEIIGVPVRVASLQGGFSGFNPVIEVNGLSMQVAARASSPEAQDRALSFDRGTVIVDIARSIWQRRWVLREFVVERLELELAQTSEGGWLLGDIAMQGGTGMDPDTLFQAFLNVAQLDLRDVVVNIRTRSGERLRFVNGAATIQNREGNHFLHVNINPEGQQRQLALSLEVRGQELSLIDGSFHVAVPAADYSDLFSGQSIAGLSVEALTGGGDVWVDFERGEMRGIVATARLDRAALRSAQGNMTTLTSLEGAFEVRADDETTHYSVSGLSFDHEGESWPRANMYLAYQPDQALTIHADRVEVAMLASLAASFDLLEEPAGDLLEQLQPAGMLENVALYVPLLEGSGELVSARANMAGGSAATVRNSPTMTGIDGYVEVTADLDARRVSGLFEVDSSDFTINIPRVYTSTWAFDDTNGSIGFELDYSQGRKLRLNSSVLVGRTDYLETRVQLASALDQRPDGERENELELLVGVLNMDAARKTFLLPDGPGIRSGLRAGMDFLERSIVDGEMRNSAAIFRGSTVPGSDRLAKTFQSFYQWLDGNLRFDPDWPELQSSRALVLTNDENLDIFMENGSSLGLAADMIEGTIRGGESGENLLEVSGRGQAASEDGLAYLLSAPAAEGLRGAMADWRIEGDLRSEFELSIPIGQADVAAEIRLHLDLTDNDLWISQYDLAIEDVTGELTFDTRTGIEQGEFGARLFDGDSRIEVSSRGEAGNVERISVVSKGRAERRALMQWPRQSGFVEGLLENARGSFLYAAELHLDQTDAGASSLRVNTDLAGLFLTLPEPFAKEAGQPLPLMLQIDQESGEQTMSGTFGPDLRFNLKSVDSVIRQGRVRLGGGRPGVAEVADGLMVDGNMDRLVLEQWTDLFQEMQGGGLPRESLDTFAYLDIDADEIDVYGQPLKDVHLRVDPTPQGLLAELAGDSVQGTIEIPLDSGDYLQVQLEHLRFSDEDESGSAPETAAAPGEAAQPEPPRLDLMARVDPRELPRMRFSVGEIAIGETPWGGWNFTLEPDATGADFTDLAFDFRGLRVNPSAEASEQLPAPRLRWQYDGRNHETELAGLVLAEDMAEVLLNSGIAASMESESARFEADLHWPGTPAFFHGSELSGNVAMRIENGRFLETNAGGGALKLISIINFDAIMRRLRLSDDLLRRGLAFDEITGRMTMDNGLVRIEDQLVISGPSSLYQITGLVDLAGESISSEMYVTLPVSDNIPWIGLITGNFPLALGAYLFDQIFGDQVDSLTSAVYTLEGPWEGLEPQFKQAFGAPGED